MVLEMVRLRARSSEGIEAFRHFWESLSSRELPSGLGRREFYLSVINPNETMLVLEWEEPGPDPGGSVLARSLSYRFKGLGLVEWSLWRAPSSPAPGGPAALARKASEQ